MARFDGEVVVITGATSGIGERLAVRFAREGARVVGTGRDPERLAALAASGAMAVPMDVTDEASVDAAAAGILAKHPRVDVVVNNAGVGLFKAWTDTTAAEIHRVMDTNLYGVERVTRRFLPAMVARGSGVIVNVASVAGRRGYPKHTAYCASKHALIGWSESLRCDLRGSGVEVVVVCPPAVRTPFFENAGYMTFDEDHPGFTPMTADDCARRIVDATATRRRTAILGVRARLLDALNVAAPGLLDAARNLKPRG